MKKLCSFVFVLVWSLLSFGQKDDFWSWRKKNAAQLGCYFEKQYQVRDGKFNCAVKKYKNHGDPCKNIKTYYEGPQFPTSKLGLINPNIKSMNLVWEHGELQSIEVSMTKKFNYEEMKKMFPPLDESQVQHLDENGPTQLRISFFDHLGAGDVECGN